MHDLLAGLLALTQAAGAAALAPDPALQRSVDELRHAIGRWHVVTEFIGADGAVARTAEGTYEFSWVVPDRVALGRSRIPELEMASGILFYVNEKRRVVEMVSVGRDGHLWVMTGPLGGDWRATADVDTAGGGTSRLRFTRHSVAADAFESRMEYSEDRGATWKPGNRQRFRRLPPEVD
jgi:hypothetical protein